MPTQLSTSTVNMTQWEITPAELRSGLASIGITVPATASKAEEGDDCYIKQGNVTIGAMEEHAPIIVTVIDAEAS